MAKNQDWICTVKWVQATPSDGAWLWTMHLVHDGVPGWLAEGVAFTKLGVYWSVWRQCRKHGLRYRPNVRGVIK
jgi:hypothetical protein